MTDRDMEIAKEISWQIVCGEINCNEPTCSDRKVFACNLIASALRRVRNEETKRYEKLVKAVQTSVKDLFDPHVSEIDVANYLKDTLAEISTDVDSSEGRG